MSKGTGGAGASVPAPRPTELTSTVHEQFDRMPPGADAARWFAFREAYHRAQRLEPADSFPLQIDFEINSTCQMRCGFCIHGQARQPQRHLPFRLFCKAIEEGQEYGLASIKLNYINEPLLNRNLEEHIRFARDHGVMNVYMATNGLLLDRARAESLISAGITKIMVSLDATTSATFAAMRKSNEFDRIRHNVHGLIAYRNSLGLDFPLVRVNFVRTAINAHEADDFLREWEGIADMIGFQSQVAVPGDERPVLSQADDNFRCSFPYKLVVIDSAGDILPCCTFSGRLMPLGNIDRMTIAEAWNSKAMNQLRQTHAKAQWRTNPVCASCLGADNG